MERWLVSEQEFSLATVHSRTKEPECFRSPSGLSFPLSLWEVGARDLPKCIVRTPQKVSGYATLSSPGELVASSVRHLSNEGQR